jgi:uncharacterized protein
MAWLSWFNFDVDWWGLLDWGLYVVLIVVLVVGWLINILGLPGLWLMFAAHVTFGLATGWGNIVGWQSTIALFVLAVLAEAIEFAAGAAGSAQAGGSKRSMAGAIVGGLGGGIVGSILIPIPILGTIIGAVGGSFAGATLVERMIDEDSQHAIQVGIGAAKGRLAGIVIKSGFGVAPSQSGRAVTIDVSPIATPAPATVPTTAPTTLPTTAPTTIPATNPTTASTTEPTTRPASLPANFPATSAAATVPAQP